MQTNIIYNTDCLALKGGLIDLPNKSIDLVVTDPPYKFENQGGGFDVKNKSTQRMYLDSLKKIGCCEFNPAEFLDILKPKMKNFMDTSFAIKH